MKYYVYDVTSIYRDDIFGPYDNWVVREGFDEFEAAKDFADQLICNELRGPEYEGAHIYYRKEVYGNDTVLVEYGAALAFRPLPYGSRGIFVVKAP